MTPYPISAQTHALRIASWVVSLTLLIPALAIGQTEGLEELRRGNPSLHAYLGMDSATLERDFDAGVPTPESVLGFEVGEWHVRHDLLVRYMERLAEASDRVQIQVTGKTHEDRPLLLLTISSPENLARLDEHRANHLALSDPESGGDSSVVDMPVVVHLGYSVHGNEPSGSNASLVVAYALAASRQESVTRLLDQAIILLDPSLNPDGLARFAQWANMHKGKVPVALADSREHQEEWPSGRTNHYWFDLNRDWLPAQHPESKARLAQFHAWRPNVLTDHHEMGSDSTFFFQPGVPGRKNPLTPARNVELTSLLAEFHAQALDSIGSSYYSEEDFDDFYYGKGSTYPDIQGAVGILFEQASSRGHLRDAENAVDGKLSFPFTIRNQVAVSFSTLEGAVVNRESLLEYQRDFYRQALDEGRKDPRGAFVFGDTNDKARAAELANLLLHHDVEVYRLKSDTRIAGQSFSVESSFVVPLAQRQYRFIRAAFDSFTSFEESTFYDVSAWTLPMAFGLAFESAPGDPSDLQGAAVEQAVELVGSFKADPEAVAYLFTWDGYYAARSLYQLLDAEILARVATRRLTAEVNGEPKEFPLGTIVVPLGLQSKDRSEVEGLLAQVAQRDGTEVFAVRTGLTPSGIDLGSPALRRLERPKPGLIVGGRAGAYEAGETWHLLDQRFGIETALITRRAFKPEVLDKLTHVILVHGAENELNPPRTQQLRNWVRRGGVVIAVKSASEWVHEAIVVPEPQTDKKVNGPGDSGSHTLERKPYGQASTDRAIHLIGGSLFEVDLDLTHPLAYGYARDKLPVFRNSRIFLDPPKNPYATVAAYTQAPLLAGYVSDKNLGRLAGGPSLIADRVGRGTVIQMVDNPNFRAFWYGTNRLFLNGIFFGGVLDHTAPGGFGRRDDH